MQTVRSNSLPTFRHNTNTEPQRFPMMSGHYDGGHNDGHDDIHDLGDDDDDHGDDNDDVG